MQFIFDDKTIEKQFMEFVQKRCREFNLENKRKNEMRNETNAEIRISTQRVLRSSNRQGGTKRAKPSKENQNPAKYRKN
jgi:hypothetical protein